MAHNLVGEKFGELTVLEKTNKPNNAKRNNVWWKCLCSCGKQIDVPSEYLVNGTKKSCNCLQDRSRKSLFGLSDTKLYRVYRSMLNRCYNSNDKSYKNYGGRGITICVEWRNDFIAFFEWATNNGYENHKTIERIDNNGNYCPENCKWAGFKEQLNNTRKNKKIEYKGESKTLAQWSDITGLPRWVIDKRIKNGWDIEKVMSTPIIHKFSHKKERQ